MAPYADRVLKWASGALWYEICTYQRLGLLGTSEKMTAITADGCIKPQLLMRQLVHQVIPLSMSSTFLQFRTAYNVLLAADIASYPSTNLTDISLDSTLE